MWPLAAVKPKHLLPIGGRPIISFILKALSDNGVKEVCMVVGFKGNVIQTTLGDGAEHGVDIEYFCQPKWTGTASALDVVREAVGEGPFLVLYGDLWVSPSGMQVVIDKSRECPNVMGVVQVPNSSEYGVVKLRGDSLMQILEKPAKKEPTEGWINAGIYALNDEIFRAIKKIPRSRRNEYELTAALQRLLNEGKEIRAATIEREEWLDIGRPWDLLEANERILMSFPHRVRGTVEPGATIRGPVWLEETATIRTGSYVEGPVYIGERSKIGPNSRIRSCTSIGNSVVVGTSCEIKNSIIMNGTKIPHLSYVGDSIIGERCNLAAGTITANIRLDEQVIFMRVKNRLMSSGRKKLGVIMGDEVQTGINTSIMPGVRIGSSSQIGPGTVVYRDVPSDHAVFVKQTIATTRVKKRLEPRLED